MNKQDVDRLGYLLSLSSEIEDLKEKARQAAKGEKVSFVGDSYVVTVGKTAKTAPRLDTKTWKATAPKEYADVFRRYHTKEGTRAGSVTAAEIG